MGSNFIVIATFPSKFI